MVGRGGLWKVPSYAVENAVEGFGASRATACHGMPRKRTILYMPQKNRHLIFFRVSADTGEGVTKTVLKKVKQVVFVSFPTIIPTL